MNRGVPVDPEEPPRTLNWASLYVDKLGLRHLKPYLSEVEHLGFLLVGQVATKGTTKGMQSEKQKTMTS